MCVCINVYMHVYMYKWKKCARRPEACFLVKFIENKGAQIICWVCSNVQNFKSWQHYLLYCLQLKKLSPLPSSTHMHLIFVHIYVLECVYVYIHIYTYLRKYTHVYKYIHIQIQECTDIYNECTYIYNYMCIYIHI